MKVIQILLRLTFPLVILAVGYFSWDHLRNSEGEKAPKKKEVRKLNKPIPWEVLQKQKKEKRVEGHPVMVRPLEKVDYPVIITSRGVSTAGEETEFSAETEGKVMELSPRFEVGSFIKKGEVLLKLDSTDLRADVTIAEARVAQAEATLVQEKAQAEQARLNWNDIGYKEEPGDLVLRKPQLKQAEAMLNSAIAQVEKAKRLLEKSVIHAPYDGIIAERSVSVGEDVRRGNSLGVIIGTEYLTVSLPIATKEEMFLPETLLKAPVLFKNPLLGEGSPTWRGYIKNREPMVDENTRQLHLRAYIDDPYSLKNPEGTPLPVGQPVSAEITGASLKNVYCVPKTALRQADSIHISNPDKILKRLKIKPLWTDEENIIFRSDDLEGCHWVETVMRSGAIGLKLKHLNAEEVAKDEDKSERGSLVH